MIFYFILNNTLNTVIGKKNIKNVLFGNRSPYENRLVSIFRMVLHLHLHLVSGVWPIKDQSRVRSSTRSTCFIRSSIQQCCVVLFKL